MSSDRTLYLLPCDVFVSPITATVPRDNIMPTLAGLTHIDTLDGWNVTVTLSEYGIYTAEANLALSPAYDARGRKDWFFVSADTQPGALRRVSQMLWLVLKTVRAHGGEGTDYDTRLVKFILRVADVRDALRDAEFRAMGETA